MTATLMNSVSIIINSVSIIALFILFRRTR